MLLFNIMMTFVAIIQARTNSTRLPNKIFKIVENKPIIEHLINRLRHSTKLNNIIIATTDQKCDDSIIAFCKQNNIDYYRGNENNVLDRYYQTAKLFNVKNIVRITSECPLMDSSIVDEMINHFVENNLDFLSVEYMGKSPDGSKLFGSHGGFPDGCNPEIFKFEVLENMWKLAMYNDELEHVTPFYRKHHNVNEYKIKLKKDYPNIDLSTLHLSLDTDDDLIMIKDIYSKLYQMNNQFTIEDVIDYLNRR